MASFHSYRQSSEADLGEDWRPSSQLEPATASALDRQLTAAGLRLLNDRSLPEHARAKFDRVTVGPGGVTVIDTKNYLVNIRLDRFGGVTARRHSVLVIDGRDHTPDVIAIHRQLDGIRAVLAEAGLRDIDVRGALCGELIAGLPRIGQVKIAHVLIDRPEPVVKLATRPGSLNAVAIDYVWDELNARLTVA